jgi:hypothetical protein
MRLALFVSFSWIAALGALQAQDTNFATGPQYLMNYGSPAFARPISTPSLSLSGSAPAVGATSATGDLIAGAANETKLPPTAVSTPSPDLFPIYYGSVPTQAIEVSFATIAATHVELPGSIVDSGMGQFTTAQALRELGYGVTLPEATAYARSQIQHAERVYTNADIAHLGGR